MPGLLSTQMVIDCVLVDCLSMLPAIQVTQLSTVHGMVKQNEYQLSG